MRTASLRRPALILATVAILAPTSRIEAQAFAFSGLDKLLDRIETVDLYYGWNFLDRKGTPSRYDIPPKDEYGLEFAFHVGSFGEKRPWEVQAAKTKKLEDWAKAKTRKDSADLIAAAADWTPKAVTIKKHFAVVGKDTVVAAVDSEFVAAPNQAADIARLWDLDFAIGYGQLGIKKNEPYELRGYVRELPSVAMYVTRWVNERLAVYWGARTGIITLQDGRVFIPGKADTVQALTVSATSIELGGALGLYVPIGKGDGASITVEVSPMWRNFNSLVAVTSSPPKNLPHQMDLSGTSISVGLLFPLGKAK